MSKGGIALIAESTDTEAWNMQVGKLVAIGPVAFKNRKTARIGPRAHGPKWVILFASRVIWVIDFMCRSTMAKATLWLS